MHELTICESLLETVSQHQSARGFTRVHRVRLEIGYLSCLDPEALRYAFSILARDTSLAGAQLEIDRPEGRAVCLDCACETEVSTRRTDCPICGGDRMRLTGGDQMRFIEMEVS